MRYLSLRIYTRDITDTSWHRYLSENTYRGHIIINKESINKMRVALIFTHNAKTLRTRPIKRMRNNIQQQKYIQQRNITF